MKIVVDRKTWARGAGGPLARPDGCMCILGLIAKQCGAPLSALKENSYYDRLVSNVGPSLKLPPRLAPIWSTVGGVPGWVDVSLVAWIVCINDSSKLKDDTLWREMGQVFGTLPDLDRNDREAWLTWLLAKADIHLTFEG